MLRVEIQEGQRMRVSTPRTRSNLRQILMVVDQETALARIVLVRTLEIVLLGNLLPQDSQEQVVQIDLLQDQEEGRQVPVQPVLHHYEAQVAQEAI